jgi:hypothetical protein
MTTQVAQISSRRLTTPRAAAMAGIFFALLYGAGYILIQISIPAVPLDTGDLLASQAETIALGLSFLPFAGIAFLWFLGVIRDRLGKLEDQFFSTLFLGSGLLYLGMTFVSAAIAGGLLTAYAIAPDLLTGSDAYLLARAITNRITTVYAIRMAGMFMIVLGTIWVRTQLMPRWLALITYLLAAVLLISIGFSHWVTVLFPAWVFLVSVYILILNFRYRGEDAKQDGMTVVE